MRLLAATLAIPVALVGWQWWSDHSLEGRLSPIASQVAGRTVHVDCQSFWAGLVDIADREGEVRFDGNGVPQPKIFITRGTCRQLSAFRKRSHHPQLDCLAGVDWSADRPLPFESPCYRSASRSIYAILILAHEAYHTAGVSNEALANCYAIQAMAWTARQLRASESEAVLVARAMAALEPYQGTDYATVECRAGSSMDRRPETPAFPTELPIEPPRPTTLLP